ncbi:MAG TPA: hypothetical protein VMZ91_02775 [Candidatus Paceibacterota bacterium]|nr:hypothetical protein [Candidatus Paceibacterota bacterium]
MPYEIFEGKKKVRKIRNTKDNNDFDIFKKRFGFSEEIDLASFCTAISFFKKYKGDHVEIFPPPSMMEMANMQSFKKAKLYDSLILHYLDIAEDRLVEFEKYFYSGFKFLRDWLERYGPNLNLEIELYSELWDFLMTEKKSDD